MSISYYLPKFPVTSVRVDQGGGHSIVSLWINHARAGYITLRNDEVGDFLWTLFDVTADGYACGAYVWIGPKGREVRINHKLKNTQQLLSEHGELVQLREIFRNIPSNRIHSGYVEVVR